MSQPEDDLRSGIRQKILAGDLPNQDCRMTWYGGGTGGICVACDQPITADDLEVECDLPQGGTIRLHRRCYDIWAAEWPTCEGA
jgi:hypothetical protein